MNIQYTLFIDLYLNGDDDTEFMKIIRHKAPQVEATIRKLTSWSMPACVNDLLIVDAAFLPCDQALISKIKTHYETVLVVNTPPSSHYYDFLYDHGVTRWLKRPYSSLDMTVVLENYLTMKQYQLEKNIWDTVIQKAHNSIVITDKSGNILFANPYFEEVSGFSNAEFLTKSPNVIKSDFHDDAFYKKLWTQISQGDVWEGIFVNKNKSGNLFYEEATISPLKNRTGNIERYLKIGKNITRERLLLEDLALEVKLAKKITTSFLAKKHRDSRIEFNYHMQHYNEIGGDFVFFEKMDDGVYNFALIDVMGHGVSAALVAIVTTQMFADYIRFNSLDTTINAINRFLCHFNNGHDDRAKYVTGVFMSFDFYAKTAKLINAGHLDVLALKKDHTVVTMPSNNMILGVVHDVQFDVKNISLRNFEQFIFFTDGLVENQNLAYNDALETLEATMLSSPDIPSILKKFQIDETAKDDVTVCNITLKPLL